MNFSAMTIFQNVPVHLERDHFKLREHQCRYCDKEFPSAEEQAYHEKEFHLITYLDENR